MRSVAIAAPAALVWELTVDVEAWPRLTPSMTEVRRLDSGPVQVGSEAEVKQPGLRAATWRVTTLQPGRLFVWATSAAGVKSVGEHLIVPEGDVCKLMLRINQTGPLAGLVGLVYGRKIRRFLEAELEGFRTAAEALAAA